MATIIQLLTDLCVFVGNKPANLRWRLAKRQMWTRILHCKKSKTVNGDQNILSTPAKYSVWAK
ncbi:MAG: hypothetical protein ACRCUY_10645 [Thermoguttaceae bacterium]